MSEVTITITATVSTDVARQIMDLVESEESLPSKPPKFATSVLEAAKDVGLKTHDIYHLIRTNQIEHGMDSGLRVVNLESVKRYVDKFSGKSLPNGNAVEKRAAAAKGAPNE